MSLPEGGGGTFALPSPTHAHHMDMTSAVRSLRRSISRSPSRFLSRTSSRGSDGSTPNSPQSPCRRFRLTPQHQHNNHLSPTKHAQTAPPAAGFTHDPNSTPQTSFTPLRPKLSLRSIKSARTTSPSRQIARARVSPKSPLRRALNAPSDSGNAAAQPLLVGGEPSPRRPKSKSPPLSPTLRRTGDKQSRHSLHLDVSGASQNAFLKALDIKSDHAALNQGGLKRNDAMMNLDQPYQGSPMPKRRSMHGISILEQGETQSQNQNQDQNQNQNQNQSIFGSPAPPPTTFKIHEDTNPDNELPTSGLNLQVQNQLSPAHSANIMKRSSSLRKTTLQSRYSDKASLGRRAGEHQLAQMDRSDTPTPSKARPSVSDDWLSSSGSRESPFTSGTPLTNSFIRPTEVKGNSTTERHPLSQIQTMSASSSGNSISDEPAFPTVAPPTLEESVPEKPSLFSRSLPVGALRPQEDLAGDFAGDGESTPNKSNKLFQPVFASTGLISKMNRNPETTKTIAPPDTPCKKPSSGFYHTYPSPQFGKSLNFNPGSNRKSFGGIPTLSFDRVPPTLKKTGRKSLFRSTTPSNDPSGLSDGLFDNDDSDSMFDEPPHQPSLLLGNVPPTPTKNGLPASLSNLSELSGESTDLAHDSPSMNRKSFGPRDSLTASAGRQVTTPHFGCKYKPEVSGNSSGVKDKAQSQSARLATVEPQRFQHPNLPISSFGRSRALRGFKAPFPLNAAQTTSPMLKLSERTCAKISRFNSASPLSERFTPQTPQEISFPDLTSQLSISRPGVDGSAAENGMAAPATPTTERDFRSSTSIFATPVNAASKKVNIDDDIDILHQRFDDVKRIGGDVFSQVYCVKEKVQRKGLFTLPSSVTDSEHNQTSTPGQVYVVKKSKYKYSGNNDRRFKLREAEILQTLRYSEHIVQYINHWEEYDHLYIQTEYCENGTLQGFLDEEGGKGRLDDFCIFKILLDLTLGLKDIHDAGFMHLDIKPANIFITFEGALKIGDFGLARLESNPRDGLMEGDRAYLPPEGMNDRFGQSADIFSLGVIIFEATANIVLPENGEAWRKIRSGDFSDVPSLAWTSSCETQPQRSSLYSDDFQAGQVHDAGNLFGSHKRSELLDPPAFMANAEHPESLRSIVGWMLQNERHQRPSADDLLGLGSLQWVADRRNAPATIFEGRFGPVQAAPTPLGIANDEDTEMIDV